MLQFPSYHQFLRCKGDLPEDQRGKYQRSNLLAFEDIAKKATKWLRAKVCNSRTQSSPSIRFFINNIQHHILQVHDKRAHLTVHQFKIWFNEFLQSPNLDLPSNIPRQVSDRTAARYMRNLGFKYKTYRQALQYTDGHERKDVIVYRKKYLNKLKGLEQAHKPPPTCTDGIPSWNAGNETKQKRIVFIYHDESVFKANDAPSMGWHDPQGSRATRPKGKGKGIMISDFVEEYGGFLALTDDELQRARQVGQYAFDQLIRLQFKNETNSSWKHLADRSCLSTNCERNLYLWGEL